jgi:hypothetical protein
VAIASAKAVFLAVKLGPLGFTLFGRQFTKFLQLLRKRAIQAQQRHAQIFKRRERGGSGDSRKMILHKNAYSLKKPTKKGP